MRRSWAFEHSAILAAFITLVSAAQAEDSSSMQSAGAARADGAADAKAAAERHFVAGLDRAEAGDWQAALVEFDASYALVPSAAALSNKAFCLQRLGQNAAALSVCEQVLSDFAGELEEEERAQLERLRADLSPLVGEVLVETSTPGASVFIDEREHRLGTTRASLKLDPGEHSIRIVDGSNPPARYRVNVQAGQRVSLATAPTPPAPRQDAAPSPTPGATATKPRHALSLDGAASLLWAPSFGGSADASCAKSVMFADGSSGPGCSDRSHPFGAMVNARFGYELLSHWWLEAGLGYLSLSSRMRRSLEVIGEKASFGSRDLDDRMTLSGGLLTLGVSYRILSNTPLIARISTGVLLGRQTASVNGSFSQTSNLEALAGGATPESGHLQLDESPAFVVAPLISPELRAGIRVMPNLTLDVGVSLLFLFIPSRTRTADAWGEQDVRRWPLTRDGANVGIVRLPNEKALGTVVAVAPSLGARWDF